MNKNHNKICLLAVGLLAIFGLIGCGPAPVALPAETAIPTINPTSTLTVAPTGTNTPEPTPIPGVMVYPLSSFASGIPWLPYDRNNAIMSVYYGFNMKKPPFNNILVRQAFAAAVDREQVAQEARDLYFNNVSPATSLTPPSILGRDLYNAVGIPFDPTRAKELLNQAGYVSGADFPRVSLIVSYRGIQAKGAYYQMAETIMGMWETNLGIQGDIELVGDMPAYINRLKTDLPDIYQLAWGADYCDPDDFLKHLFRSDSDMNFGHFNNSAYDSLVDRAAIITDPAERQLLYIQAEQILTEYETGIIPLYHSNVYSN